MRVFLDANILFSACRGAGAMRDLLQAKEAAGHTLVADAYVAIEARRNLASKADEPSLLVLDALLDRIEVQPRQPGAASLAALDWLDSKDRPVLLAAIAAACDVLVTGDKKHFGPAYGRRHEGVLVCSPAQLFALLQQESDT